MASGWSGVEPYSAAYAERVPADEDAYLADSMLIGPAATVSARLGGVLGCPRLGRGESGNPQLPKADLLTF